MNDSIRHAAGVLESDFRALSPGDFIVYHVGLLMADRQQGDPDQRARVNAQANAAMQLEQEGRAELVQKRLGPYCCEYRLVRRGRVSEDTRCHWPEAVPGGRTMRLRKPRPQPAPLLAPLEAA